MFQSSADIRSELRASIKRRGRRKYNVWTGYAAKGGFRFVLDGTPNALHLVWLEANPDVVSYRIPNERIVGRGNEGPEGTIPDAICILKSGQVEWHEVKTEEHGQALTRESSDQVITQVAAAERYGVRWRLITVRDLLRDAVLINNWRRGLSYLWASTSHDLRPFHLDIKTILLAEHSTTIERMLGVYEPAKEPLLIAAFFSLLQRGEIRSDLEDRPLSLSTLVRET